MRQFSECSKNHIELLKKIRKVSLCVLEYIEKFNAGGFSVKLECSEGKVSLEQGYALKKIIPVLHAMWVNMCFTSCPALIQRYKYKYNTNTEKNALKKFFLSSMQCGLTCVLQAVILSYMDVQIQIQI